MEKEFREKKLQSFKEWWLKIVGVEPSEKLVWYFEKGIEKQLEIAKRGEPNIVGERYFNTALLIDDEHYPDRTEYEDCQRAFCQGFYTDMRTT